MDDQTRRISEMGTRMKSYRAVTGDDFPSNNVGGQRFSTLEDLMEKVVQLGSRIAQEKGAAKAAKEAKEKWLENIRRQMKAMRKTMVSCEGQQPGVSQHFKMPSSNSAESIIEGARAFLATATTMKALFLGREMPDNFLEVLDDAIQNYEAAANDYNLHTANRMAARTMLSDVCEQILVMRRELDPIIRNKYANDDEKLALWVTASHFEKPRRKSKNGEPGDGNETPEGEQS